MRCAWRLACAGAVACALRTAPLRSAGSHRRNTVLRADYLSSLDTPDAAPSAPSAVPPAPPLAAVDFGAAKRPSSVPNLSESVLADFSDRSERNMELARLQTQLERSMLRKQQVEELVGEELAALRVQLDRELESEAERREGAVALVAQLDAAKSAKQGACDREQQLLVQLQDVAQRTEEPAVSASLAAAIETKAGLVAIELLLVDDIEECLAQVVVEQDEIAKRIAAMTRVRASLPASDDVDALRLYTWSEVSRLQEELRLGALAIAQTDAKVAALRERITDSLQQRQAVLGSAPLFKTPVQEAPAPPPATTRVDGVRVQNLDLSSLDDTELAEQVKAAAGTTARALGALGRSALATFGALAASEGVARAGELLSSASNETSEVTLMLSAVDAKETEISSTELASRTAKGVASSAGKFGSAVSETASSAAKAAAENELSESALSAASALGTTASAAGFLAFKAAQRAAAAFKAKLDTASK